MLLVLLAAFTLTACNPGPKIPNTPSEDSTEEKPFVSKLPKATGDSQHYNGWYKCSNDGMDLYLSLNKNKSKSFNDNIYGYMITVVGKNVVNIQAIVGDEDMKKHHISDAIIVRDDGSGQRPGEPFRIAGCYELEIENNKFVDKSYTLHPSYVGWMGVGSSEVEDFNSYEHKNASELYISKDLYIEFAYTDYATLTDYTDVPKGSYINNEFIEYEIMEGEKIRGNYNDCVVHIPDITPLAFYGNWTFITKHTTELPFSEQIPENYYDFFGI